MQLFDLPEWSVEAEVLIADMQGRPVSRHVLDKQQVSDLDLSAKLSSGTYLITLVCDGVYRGVRRLPIF